MYYFIGVFFFFIFNGIKMYVILIVYLKVFLKNNFRCVFYCYFIIFILGIRICFKDFF